MDSSGQQAGSDQQGSQSKKRGRGPTRMRGVEKARDATQFSKIPVEFDDDMKAIGEGGTQLNTYVGHLARSKVSIEYENWKAVHPDVKNMVWEDILMNFDIPATEKMRKRLLNQMDERWRNFKSNLARDYLRGSKKGQHPMVEYPGVSDEAWRKFVERRETNKFKELSEKNKQIAMQNKYPHHMSRGGYSGLEQRMMEEQLKAAQEAAASDPSGVIQSIQRPSRQQKWKAARLKQGQYITPESAIIAERIVSF